MRSLTLTFTFRWLYLTQGRWARILTPPLWFIAYFCIYLAHFCVANSSFSERFLWNRVLISRASEAGKYKHQEREWGGRTSHPQMTPSESPSSTKGQLIQSLTCHRTLPPPFCFISLNQKHIVYLKFYLKVLLSHHRQRGASPWIS